MFLHVVDFSFLQCFSVVKMQTQIKSLFALSSCLFLAFIYSTRGLRCFSCLSATSSGCGNLTAACVSLFLYRTLWFDLRSVGAISAGNNWKPSSKAFKKLTHFLWCLNIKLSDIIRSILTVLKVRVLCSQWFSTVVVQIYIEYQQYGTKIACCTPPPNLIKQSNIFNCIQPNSIRLLFDIYV